MQQKIQNNPWRQPPIEFLLTLVQQMRKTQMMQWMMIKMIVSTHILFIVKWDFNRVQCTVLTQIMAQPYIFDPYGHAWNNYKFYVQCVLLRAGHALKLFLEFSWNLRFWEWIKISDKLTQLVIWLFNILQFS